MSHEIRWLVYWGTPTYEMVSNSDIILHILWTMLTKHILASLIFGPSKQWNNGLLKEHWTHCTLIWCRNTKIQYDPHQSSKLLFKRDPNRNHKCTIFMKVTQSIINGEQREEWRLTAGRIISRNTFSLLNSRPIGIRMVFSNTSFVFIGNGTLEARYLAPYVTQITSHLTLASLTPSHKE